MSTYWYNMWVENFEKKRLDNYHFLTLQNVICHYHNFFAFYISGSTKITNFGGSERRKEAPILPSFEHEMAELMVIQRNQANSKLSPKQLKIAPKYINKHVGHLNGDVQTDLSALSLADTREIINPSKTNEKNGT